MNETSIIGSFFKPRQKAIARYATEAEAIQIWNRLAFELTDLVEYITYCEWASSYSLRD